MSIQTKRSPVTTLTTVSDPSLAITRRATMDATICNRCRKRENEDGYKRCAECRAYHRKVMSDLSARGLCQKCCCRSPVRSKRSDKYCQICLDKTIATSKARAEKRTAGGKCRRCGNDRAKNHQLCRPCQAAGRDRYQDLRDEVFAAYGGYKCQCCSETEPKFLQIDHVNNDGAEHRRQMKGGGNHLYGWLKKNGYPVGFQVLCANCNRAKQFGPCPHQVAKEGYRADQVQPPIIYAGCHVEPGEVSGTRRKWRRQSI